MYQYLVILGAAVNLIGTSFYIRRTLRGQNKPNRVTYLLWSAAPMIATGAGLSAGAGWATLPVFASGFIPFLVFLASFYNPQAYWKLSALDYVCGAFSVVSLILWMIVKEPNAAIALAIISDGLAGMPTLIKSWKFPETESASGYLAAIFSAGTSFAAIKRWNFSELAFPIYLIAMCSAISFAVLHRKILKYFSRTDGALL
ncbi:MAG: hypothetical protein UV36_C0006G0005 [Parcubacteria group bacterium GW2011_GWC2_42_6]|nr:MAG: hypothetical protein UV36_C0006G0005 [Parcubacteria group bacterium GW2011_GWC2_42_6]